MIPITSKVLLISIIAFNILHTVYTSNYLSITNMVIVYLFINISMFLLNYANKNIHIHLNGRLFNF